MLGRWQRVLHLLQLVRPAEAFAAVGNSWLIVFLAYGAEDKAHCNTGLDDYPLWAFLILGGAVAAGLHTYGVALNDLLDVRHDRVFSPQRPIAAGGVGRTAAVMVCVVSLLLALTAGLFMGRASMLLCLLTAGLILFYNGLGKFVPTLGLLLLGVIRVLNMLAANPKLTFGWPLWLTLTHVLACGALAYQAQGKRPRLRGQDAWMLCGGWVFATLGLLHWMSWQAPPRVVQAPLMWAGPLAAGGLLAVLGRRMLGGADRSMRTRRAAGASFSQLAAWWLMLYDAGWLLGARLYWQGLVLLALAAAAYLVIRLVKVLTQLSGPAPAYRLTVRPADAAGA